MHISQVSKLSPREVNLSRVCLITNKCLNLQPPDCKHMELQGREPRHARLMNTLQDPEPLHPKKEVFGPEALKGSACGVVHPGQAIFE